MNAEVTAAPTAPEKKEFWRWQENVWVDETKDWKTAKIVTCGIDVGSVSSQAVLVVDGELYGFNSVRPASAPAAGHISKWPPGRSARQYTWS